MLAVAHSEPAVIFPEGAALAAGVWVLGHDDRGASPLRLAVLTPAAAAGGVGLASPRSGWRPGRASSWP